MRTQWNAGIEPAASSPQGYPALASGAGIRRGGNPSAPSIRWPEASSRIGVRPEAAASIFWAAASDWAAASFWFRNLIPLAALLCLISPLPLFSQSDTLAADSTALDEVVITAQYQPGSANNSVYNIRIIDRAKIEAMGAQDLGDVLTNQLNLRIGQDPVLGSGIQMQGISGQNVKVLIDGVPVIGRVDGNIDVSQVLLGDVERIEVVEGPLAVSYGTDALAGTINIITKRSQKRSLSLRVDSYYESIGQYNFSGRMGLRQGKNIFSLSGGRNYFDGWTDGDGPFSYIAEALADSSRFQSWKPKEQLFARGAWSRYFGQMKLELSSAAFLETMINRGLPRPPYQETAFDDRYRTLRLDQALRITGELDSTHYLAMQAACNHYRRTKNTWFRDLTTLDAIPTGFAGDQDTTSFWDFSSRGTLSSTRKARWWNYELGYDAHLETAQGARIADGQRKLLEIASFGSMEVTPLNGLMIRPGLRYAYNSAYAAPFVPSLNIKYSHKKLSLRAAYARGFRAPSLKELHLAFQDINHDITGNPNLKAEVSHHIDQSTTLQTTIRSAQLQLETGLFLNAMRNLITLAQSGSGNSYTYVNVGKYATHGLQARADLTHKGLQLSLGASLTGRLNPLPDSLAVNQRFAYSPEARASLNYLIRPLKLRVSLFYKFTGRLQTIAVDSDGNLLTQQMGGYHLADASLGRGFGNGKFQISVGGKNLFNVRQVAATLQQGAHSGGETLNQVGTGTSILLQMTLNLESRK